MSNNAPRWWEFGQAFFDYATMAHKAWLDGNPCGKRMEGDRVFTLGTVPTYIKAKDGIDLHGKELSLAEFPMLTMKRANFRAANLCDARLDFCDMSGSLFTNANMSGASFGMAKLRRVDLRGADLRHADLSFADLRGADLSSADMTGACMVGVRLDGAIMRDAILERTNLSFACMRNVDFSGANLHLADLKYTNLCEAIFANANLYQAEFVKSRKDGANFCNATGIEKARHLMDAKTWNAYQASMAQRYAVEQKKKNVRESIIVAAAPPRTKRYVEPER